MNKLFSVAKVGAFIDSYSPGLEKRRGEEISVLKVRLRIQPFDSKLATALDEGVGGDSNIRSTIFSMTTGDPKANFTSHEFKLGSLPRQTLELFSTPDTPGSRLALNQCKISGCKVRGEKDSNALAFLFSATFGPVGRDELEAIHALFRLQTFVSFHEGEPLLEEEQDADDEEGTDADVKAQRLAPMFDDDGKPTEVTSEEREEGPTTKEIGSRRKLHSHQSKAAKGRRRKAAAADTDADVAEA